MIKIFRALSILICMALISTGCTSNNIDEDDAAEVLVNQVFECLNNEDIEALKELFSNNISAAHDLDEEIADLYKFFDGKIVSYDEFDSGSSRENIRSGKQTLLVISPWIENVSTDCNKTYEVRVCAYIVCEEDKDEVGIAGLKIIAEDETECLVGDW